MSTRSIAVLGLLLAVVACKSEGTIGGELTETTPPSVADQRPPAKHEHVSFEWTSNDGALSGEIRTTLPEGEAFVGRYHEITSTTTVNHLGGFYGSWYGPPWGGFGWGWGGAWPYYGSSDDFITNYSGRVVAMLDGDRDTHMRCWFDLDDGTRGMKGGGEGECQLSNGDRITAMFAPE